jgi:hypothetical protein
LPPLSGQQLSILLIKKDNFASLSIINLYIILFNLVKI